MSDPTTETLRRTMQAIVASAPEAPVLDVAEHHDTVRRPRPVLVMAGAFALVLLVGALTSIALFDGDQGTGRNVGTAGENVATTRTSVVADPSIVFDPRPSTWDVVVIIDAGELVEDADGVARAVEQIGTATGVEAVAVVSPADVAAALGWDVGANPGIGAGIFVVAGGDALVAETAAFQAKDGWNDGVIQVIYSQAVSRANAVAELDRLAQMSREFNEVVSIGLESGPEPGFDTAALGEEMPLENAFDGVDEDTVVTHPAVLGPDADPVVYIGSVSGVDGYVYGVETDRGTPEICQSASWTQLDTSMVACFSFDEPGLSQSVGMAEDASTGTVISVTALEDRVSVVGVELQTGERYWQRPVAGSVMFVVFEPGALIGPTMTAYGADGGTVATETFGESP